MIIVTLPWPNRILSPNSRSNWRRRAEMTRLAKDAAIVLTRQALDTQPFVHHGDTPISVALIFCPPDRRGRDLDNCLSQMKSSLDAIAFVLGVNDRLFRPSLDWGVVGKPGHVHITIGA